MYYSWMKAPVFIRDVYFIQRVFTNEEVPLYFFGFWSTDTGTLDLRTSI